MQTVPKVRENAKAKEKQVDNAQDKRENFWKFLLPLYLSLADAIFGVGQKIAHPLQGL